MNPEVAKLDAAIAQIGLNRFAEARLTLAELTNPKVVEADTTTYYRALTDARLGHADEAFGQWDAIKTPGLWRDAATVEKAKFLLAGGQWAKAIAVLELLRAPVVERERSLGCRHLYLTSPAVVNALATAGSET